MEEGLSIVETDRPSKVPKSDVVGDEDRWISYAVAHNVQELWVELNCYALGKDMRLPSCLFTSKSLLKLNLHLGLRILEFPSKIRFSKLKTLTLVAITLFDDNFFTKLFSSCPLLQNLEILACDVSHLNVLAISTPTLQVLYYYGDIPREFILDKLPSLSEVSLSFLTLGPTIPTLNYRATKILKAINCGNMLEFCSDYMESLSAISNLSTHLPPSCPKLKHLYLAIRPTESHVRVMVSLLKSYPCIKLLDICFVPDTTVNALNREVHWNLKELSTVLCMLNNFEKVDIYTFETNEVVLDMVRVIIGNAHVLKKMTFDSEKKYMESGREKWLEIYEKIQTFPRASSCATIDVVT
ncbi:hypothetical protein GIB67_015172 [Kingdonia uniflora]|uniref:FBD domain-containing protein n=1 Tax=Kingdonia uniflora TaxID=39325 RepID=A0A7J7LJ50_9MAGN|nr:hypothetical protein GIB67_015172 [Kingdonia uniflora]